jgi:anti-anti-sigma factor
MAPADVSPAGTGSDSHSKLIGRRILVVDPDESVRNDAHALLDQGPVKVIIDSTDLDYISSAGLRVILTTAKKAKAAGGGLTIACATVNVKEVLVVSGFDGIFGMHDSIAAAVAALG